MSKPTKFITTLVLGAAGGAAAAVFLASKTGKVVKEKVTGFLKEYQEDPESKHAEWADKAQELKDQALEKYTDVKHKFETGELTPEDLVKTVKDKADELKERVSQDEFFTNLKDQASKLKSEIVETDDEEFTDVVFDGESISEDITIELTEPDLLADEVLENEPTEGL